MDGTHLTAEAVSSKILDLAAEFCDRGQTISPDSNLRDIGFDELDAVELVMAVEDEFEVDLDPQLCDKDVFVVQGWTVQALVDVTMKALGEKPFDPGVRVGLGGAVPGPCQSTSCAPKLAQADIEAVIVGEHFFTASHGIDGAYVPHLSPRIPEGMERVTFCVLTLRNGAKVTGVNHGTVSAANFDAAIGRQYARANAVEKVWELEGYLLRERLANRSGDVDLEALAKEMVDRFLGWKLPQNFAPDGGVSFVPPIHWPTGTNLLHAGQALEMFRYCLGLDAAEEVQP